MSSIEDAPEGMLRAWADAGVISSARYVEEMERRRADRTIVLPTPPLDYALEHELDIPDLEFADFAAGDDEGTPAPRSVYTVIIIAAVLFGIALWRIWP
ncbi:hypothetical protein [Mesorhizobium sp.]|uniref:hypothetical protein n=1 Tax=Mesorhizobium sp. TaxID=1871066 RepID=UPI000FE7288E|nr:hypothetical protein [Mesorhizobium sp.]RWH31615.1 MAG: hypothetical protein EOQ76_07310 [Mesorhizobium sp.]TIR57668.1 MAG: hypothetical protein E5X22_22860 [Mesorhizobium sp.]